MASKDLGILNDVLRQARRRCDAYFAPYTRHFDEQVEHLEEDSAREPLAEQTVDDARSPAPLKARPRVPTGRSRIPHFDRLLALTGVRDPDKIFDEPGQFEVW